MAKLAALYAVSFKPTEISPRPKTCREAGGYAGCDIGSQFWNQGRTQEIRDRD